MDFLKLSLCVFRYPIDSFRALQASRKSYSLLAPAVLLVLLAVFRLCSIFITHYPLASVDPREANLLVECLIMVVPVVAFAAVHFAVSSVLDGETTLVESFSAAVFAVMPLVVFQIPMALLSHLFGTEDGMVFGILNTSVYIWVGILLLISVKTMNNYSLFRSLLILLIDALGLALLTAVALLMYALSSQFVSFVTGIAREIRFAFGG